jgi:hypothetical protein
MSIPTFIKDPNDVLDFAIDWTAWLAATDDQIDTSSWIVPSGITLDSEDTTTVLTTAWLSGGTEDETYRLVNRIVTNGGRTVDKSIDIRIQTR